MDISYYLSDQPYKCDFLISLICIFGESDVLIALAFGLIKVIDEVAYLNVQ